MRLRTAFLTALLLPAPLFAQVTYYYTGNDFNTLSAVGETQVYTTSDSVSGEFTVSGSGLAGSILTLTPVTVTSFSFTDGYQTITNLSANLSSTIEVETDASGDITAWIVREELTGPALYAVITSYYPGVLDIDDGQFDVVSTNHANGVIQFSPGTWSTTPPVSTSVTATPEPSSFLLLLTALPALAAASRRWPQHSSIAPGLYPGASE